MWLSPAIAGIVGARCGPLFEPRRGLHFIPRASGIDCCEMFTAGRVSSTPRPFIGRWTLVWQAGVCLRQMVDHRGCSQEVANGQSHGFTFPSGPHTRCAYRCRSLNKQIMCQINFEVYGNSSNKYFNHESSNFMLSGNRRRGRQKAKKKQQKKHSQDSRGCILRMLVAQREHHRQESVPVRYIRMPMSLRLGFLTSYDMLTNVMRVVSQ